MSTVNRRSLILGVSAFALAACSSGPVPTDSYYRLTPTLTLSARNSGPLSGIAEVTPIRGEGVVNARAILFRKSASQLQQYSYHFWADTPAAMLQRHLVDALRAARSFDTVAMPEMKLNRDYEVMGSLRKLENDISKGGGRAIVEMELGVRKVSGNNVLLLKVYAAEVPAASSDMTAVVAAFSAAVSQILGQFGGDLGQIQGS